jgi:peptidoglycan-N-acetylglucosamine deacetylase
MKSIFNKKISYVLYGTLAVGFIIIILAFSSHSNKKTEDTVKVSNLQEDSGKSYIEAQMEVLNNTKDKAKVISRVDTGNKQITLVFEGMGSSQTMNGIVELLKKHGIKATFFLPGIRVTEEPNIANNIAKAGQIIGNNTLKQHSSLQNATDEDLIKEFYRTNTIIKENTGVNPNLFECLGTTYTDKLCTVAQACGLEYLINPNLSFNNQRFLSSQETDVVAKATKRGSIISIATDGKYDVVALVQNVIDSYEKEGFAFVDSTKLIAQQKDSEKEAVDMKATNAINSDIFSFANTSYGYVALTFEGIGNKELTMNILNELDKSKIKATFIASGYEILDNIDLAKEVLNRGHKIENQGFTGKDLTKLSYDETKSEIFRGSKVLSEELNLKSQFVLPPFGSTNDTVHKAASDLGYVVATYSKKPQQKNKSDKSDITEYFKSGVKRGDIIELTEDSPNVVYAISEIAKLVYDTGYSFVTLDKLYNSQYVNTSLKNIKGWNDITTNKDFNPNADVLGSVIQNIPTKDKTVFLTFDDWGSDKAINNILDLLSKYKVKASFFLIGSGVKSNPNLAKAISDNGHDVGNHTYSHKVITKMSTDELQQEIVNCYQSLTSAIKRKPDLMFRSPTLELDNLSANAVLACGYKYIVAGHITPRDFDVNVPASDIIKEVTTNVVPGDIISLHLTDHSSAIAVLPQIIEDLQSQGYKFAKLSDYLK